MKAVVCTQYGAPEVLEMVDVNQPEPKENELLIKIRATSVTSGDARIRRADPYMIRLIFGFKKPRKSILGVVVAGEIESIGKNVTKFKVGDKVFGTTGMSFGAHAQFQCVPEDATLALMPDNMNFGQAAAIPFGATAALHFLRKAEIKEGQKILIYGASGALGTAAIQLAKYFGAEVTAVCSAANAELVKDLGADKVIDYTTQDFSESGEKYDVLFETVGKTSLSKARRALKKNGKLLMASADICTMLRGAISSMRSSKKVFSGVIKETVSDMNYLRGLIQSNDLKAVIDRTFTLDQIAAAHAHVDTGHKKGNVIIDVQH